MTDNLKESKIILQEFLPRNMHGWKVKGKDKIYDPKTIFDYIDGAGEVYRSYNFKILLARRFTKKGQPDIVADLFDMASSKDAFGVFTHDLEGDDAGVGQGSSYRDGLLSFWKGHYYISLYAEEETEDAKNTLLAMGREVASSIEKEGEKPDIISLLPGEFRGEKNVHYFHNHVILSYHFYVSDENILLLDQQTEAVLGIFREGDERSYLLLVRYPEVKIASRAYKKFTEAYMPDAEEPGLLRTEDLKWTAARFKKNFIIIIFNAPSDSFARNIVEKVEKNIG